MENVLREMDISGRMGAALKSQSFERVVYTELSSRADLICIHTSCETNSY